MAHAWIIDVDHLAEPGHEPGSMAYNAATIVGPSDAPDALVEWLQAGVLQADQLATSAHAAGLSVFRFKIFDDDGELYYSGRLIVDADSDATDEDVCYAPLGDFGRPNAGATSITYAGHPELDCG